jgi:hypothetical protein
VFLLERDKAGIVAKGMEDVKKRRAGLGNLARRVR